MSSNINKEEIEDEFEKLENKYFDYEIKEVSIIDDHKIRFVISNGSIEEIFNRDFSDDVNNVIQFKSLKDKNVFKNISNSNTYIEWKDSNDDVSISLVGLVFYSEEHLNKFINQK